MFFTSHAFCSLRLFKLKTEGQIKQYKKKTSPKSYKIKILANPGLAGAGFEQPSPGLFCDRFLALIGPVQKVF